MLLMIIKGKGTHYIRKRMGLPHSRELCDKCLEKSVKNVFCEGES